MSKAQVNLDVVNAQSLNAGFSIPEVVNCPFEIENISTGKKADWKISQVKLKPAEGATIRFAIGLGDFYDQIKKQPGVETVNGVVTIDHENLTMTTTDGIKFNPVV